ncbi:MAG: hypothetical protein SCK29_04770 [Bacillota bacterium]|nr:hypothetical protein [Bacillota bacterium]
MGDTVKWQLVETADGEFTSSDILFLWGMLHVFVASNSGFPACNELIMKLQPLMERVYSGL